MSEVRFRGRPVASLVSWVVCLLVGVREEEWYPLTYTIRPTRSQAIAAYGRRRYDRDRRRGVAACMMLVTTPVPHASMGGRDRPAEGGGDA